MLPGSFSASRSSLCGTAHDVLFSICAMSLFHHDLQLNCYILYCALIKASMFFQVNQHRSSFWSCRHQRLNLCRSQIDSPHRLNKSRPSQYPLACRLDWKDAVGDRSLEDSPHPSFQSIQVKCYSP